MVCSRDRLSNPLVLKRVIQGLFLIVFQIGLLTQYWTKFNVASLIVSVILFFLVTRITQSQFLFQKSPLDYPFVGMVPLKWLIAAYFQPPPLRELLL